MTFKAWLRANLIPAKKVVGERYQYDIEGVGRFLVLRGVEEAEGDKILNARELTFCLNDAEVAAVEESEALKYFVFEFGQCWYYSPIKAFKDEYNDISYKVEFNDFLYLGQLESGIEFNHLGIHTEYELLNSAMNFKAAVKKTKFLGHRALGMCDQNTLGGILGFQIECVTQGIKPILGMTVTVAIPLVNSPQPLLYEGKVYALNAQGWQNMLAINACINRDPAEPWIWEEVLFKHGKGLAWVFSYEKSILRDVRNKPNYVAIIIHYKKAFTQCYQQFSVISYTDPDFDLRLLKGLQHYLQNYVKLLPPIYIDDVHYLNSAEATIKTMINKVGGTVQSESLDQYMRSEDEVVDEASELLAEDKEYCGLGAGDIVLRMLKNVEKLVDSVDFLIPIGTNLIPAFPAKDTRLEFNDDYLIIEDSDELFTHLVKLGFNTKIKGKIPKGEIKVYRERMNHELAILLDAGLSDYFLILWDIILSEKKAGGMVGPGRGSVGGSLVAFLLNITQVDPIKYDLLFERFVNPSRIKPDNYYELTMETGEVWLVREADPIPLVDGTTVLAECLTTKHDIDFERLCATIKRKIE